MPVTSLTLKGFKSFGEKCSFTFSPGFTAIVGPNGSGKSNILDALKWILGEGSASGLRISRQSDLLFQGGSSSPPADSAEVIMRVKSGGDSASVRRVYSRDGGSLLWLDGKRILLQDLDGIKRRFGLEGEGFALIGQGEISQAIHQRPKDRRRQLDALFGIERYREKREDSMRKLTDTQNESQRIQTLMRDLQARRDEISDDVNIAIQARDITDNLELLRRDYYFSRRYSGEREQSDLELARHIMMSRLYDAEKWRGIWESCLKHYEGITAHDTQNDSLASRLEAAISRKDAIQRRAFQLSTQTISILARRKYLADELDGLKSRCESLRLERQRAQNEHDGIQSELAMKEDEFSRREKAYHEAESESHSRALRRKKLENDIAGLKAKISRAESDFGASESSCITATQEINALESELEAKNESLSRLNERKSSLEDEYTRLTFTYRQKNAEIQTLRRELSHTESQYNSLTSTATYTAGIYPEPVRIILTASEKGMLRSKPIAAADVLSCSSQAVAEAVEAYLGGRQYWLLVRTIDEAQEGISFLKSNMAGRATYLPLERCRPRERDYRVKISGGVIGWAMDLVNVIEGWQSAIAHMMGDLLIVSDYATGAEIVRAGARFPIATAEGDIFAPSGAVTGGASRQKSGAVTARKRVQEIQSRIEALRGNIAEITGRLEALMSDEHITRREAEESESRLDDVRAEISSEERNIKALRRNIERLNDERAKSENSMQTLQRDIEAMKEKIPGLEAELSGIPNITAGDYDSILAPMKNELRLLRERLKSSGDLCGRIEAEYANVIAGIERSKREIDSGLATESANRQELFTLAREKSSAYHDELALRAEISRINAQHESSRRKTQRVREKLSRSAENISRMKNDIAGIEAKISRIEDERSQMIDMWEEKYPYDPREAKETDGGRGLVSSLRKLERELKSLGAYNLGALSEDEALTERIGFLSEQLDDVNTSADELKSLIDDTDSQVEREFSASMAKIDSRFNELFVRLFGGGEARLMLQEGGSIWDKGAEIFARPPGKNLQNITQLSGGEQSLTSIALIFATLEAAGTPLAVLDEVDAALDEYNLVRFAELAREYSRTMQIIAMTHRRATMERADLIYGVTMIEAGLSAVVGIDPANYA